MADAPNQTGAKRPDDAAVARRSRRIVVACVATVLAMGGLAFASVPLYDLFCRVTGYGGTTRVADSNDGVEVLDRLVTVRFDANVAPGLQWQFKADVPSVTMRIGEMGTMFYRAKNLSDQPTVGTATYNVTPGASGAYFSKIACFCFTEQRLEPGQEIEMGVTFYVDPAMVDDADTASVTTITLSYTFFRAATSGNPLAAAAPVPARPDPS